jgi:hypothetical protein
MLMLRGIFMVTVCITVLLCLIMHCLFGMQGACTQKIFKGHLYSPNLEESRYTRTSLQYNQDRVNRLCLNSFLQP